MNNKFVFKAETYNAACGRLNKIDREIFYDRSAVNPKQYYLLFSVHEHQFSLF